ncbi:MAG: YlxR family protein [Actinomycetota bacterium]
MSGRRSRRAVPREERSRRRRTHARRCVSCRRARPKAEMIRIVRNSGGTAEVDRAAIMPGRGAYVCPDPACVRVVHRRLAGALRADGVDGNSIVRDLEAVDA